MTKIQKSLNSYITTEMDYWDFSGVVRVIQNGRIIFETCRGYSNIEFGIKIQWKQDLRLLLLPNSLQRLQL